MVTVISILIHGHGEGGRWFKEAQFKLLGEVWKAKYILDCNQPCTHLFLKRLTCIEQEDCKFRPVG